MAAICTLQQRRYQPFACAAAPAAALPTCALPLAITSTLRASPDPASPLACGPLAPTLRLWRSSASSMAGPPATATGPSRTPSACGSCSCPTCRTDPPPSRTGQRCARAWPRCAARAAKSCRRPGGTGVGPDGLDGWRFTSPITPGTCPHCPAGQVPAGDPRRPMGGAHPRMDQVGHAGMERDPVQR